MKISTKGRYGLRILMDLAVHQSDKPRLIRDMALSQQISEKYVSCLVVALRRGGLIRSIRGVKGGFHLAKAPEKITLLEVVECMEGPLSVVDCVNTPRKCARGELCAARSIWQRLNDNIRNTMAEITLAEISGLCHKGEADPLEDPCI